MSPKSQPTSSDESSENSSDRQEIDLECVQRVRVMQQLKALKIKASPDAPLKTAVEKLQVFYLEQRASKGVEMALCDRCNFIGPSELDACPACGEPNADAESSRMGGGSSEADSAGDIERRETSLAVVSGGGKSMIAAPPPAAVVVHSGKAPTEDDLEAAVGRIQGFKRTFATNSWDIGHELNRLEAETPDRPALWRLRKDEGDPSKPAYDTFQAFLRAEIGFSSRMAKGLQYIARAYTKDQVVLSGSGKIEVVLAAPVAEQKRLLAASKTTPIKELRKTVRDLNIAAGNKHSVARKKKAELKAAIPAPALPPGKKAEPEKTKSDISTLVLSKSRGRFALYRAEKDAKGKLTAAHSVTDAWGWLEGQNGVKLTFKLERGVDGKLFVRYDAKRSEG